MHTFLMLLVLTFASSVEARSTKDSSSSSSCDCPDSPQFGYFYVTNDQTLPGGQFAEVFWIDSGSVHTDGIFVNPSDPCEILLQKRGVYLATYIVTGDNQADQAQPEQQFQFALYLNDGETPIPGSTYATYTGGQTEAINMKGSVIFHVSEKNSTLALVNQCENTVEIDNDAGTNNTGEFGNNVSASLVIRRLSNQDFGE